VTTCSGESEAIGWSRAAKAVLKWAAVMEKTTTKEVPIYGYNDNEAVRLAFFHGTSPRMAHLSRHAGVHYDFVRTAGLIPRHIDGEHNVGDIFTKILTAKRLRWLVRKVFDLDHPNEDRNLKGLIAKFNVTRRATVGAVFAHFSGCENEEVQEWGKMRLNSCFCRTQLEL
jgi:hypothetical protein